VLKEAAAALKAGRAVNGVEADARDALTSAGFERIDYIEARGAEDLSRLGPGPIGTVPARLLAAAWLGRTRLIDNVAV